MQLDTTKYEEYLEIQRGAPGGLSDLFARYVITLPATDADITAQIRTVRTYWREIEGRAKFREVAQFLLAEDQRLRAEYGAKMDTAAWWQAQQVTVSGSQGLQVGEHNSQVNLFEQGGGHLLVAGLDVSISASRSAGLQPPGALDAPGNARRGARRIGRILRRAVMPIDALTVLRSSQTELQIRALDVIETELDRAYTALGPPLGVGRTPR